MSTLVALRSIHDIMAAEALLLERPEIRFDLVPTPTSISTDCGMMIEFDEGSLEAGLAIIRGADLPVLGTYPWGDSGS